MIARGYEAGKKIAPSILSADFSRLGEEVKAAEEAGGDYLHIDIMDGHFVPNLTMGPPVVKSIRKITALPLDVHLMIANPDAFIDPFIEAGSDILTVHVEVCLHLHRTLTDIRKKGVRAGISLNPATPLSCLEEIFEYTDLILVMTVNPGFGGQEFIPSVLPKIERIRRLIDDRGWPGELEVDGGIKEENIGRVARAGGDVFVCGSAFFGTPDYRKTLAGLRRQIALSLPKPI